MRTSVVLLTTVCSTPCFESALTVDKTLLTSFAESYGFARIRTGVTGTQGPKYGQANPRTLTILYRAGTVKRFVPKIARRRAYAAGSVT